MVLACNDWNRGPFSTKWKVMLIMIRAASISQSRELGGVGEKSSVKENSKSFEILGSLMHLEGGIRGVLGSQRRARGAQQMPSTSLPNMLTLRPGLCGWPSN